MSSKSFGVRKDGLLVFCKAKPENRGKGNCFHTEHLDFTKEQISAGALRDYNEKAVEKYVRESGLEPVPFAKKTKQVKVFSLAYTAAELEESSNEIAEQIKNEDFDFIKNFYEQCQSELFDEETQSNLAKNTAERILNYLESDLPAVIKLREYLGEDTNIKDLSEILFSGVGAMTGAFRWSSTGRASLARSMLSTYKNDMTKNRYVASVLFFAGRCCYCNRGLSRAANQSYQPTGEHITPVWPDDANSAVGGTRYGNMALACRRCNNDRGSEDLSTWINKTSCIRKADKANTLGRIKAFRSFANYSDYSQDESDKIRAAINRAQIELDKIREPNGQIIRGHGDAIRQKIAQELSQLKK